MVAIFTGLGAGLTRGSANILGGAGQLGGASQGRSGETISVNAATGNLVINQQDEFLIGRGLDAGVSRTYNSLTDTTDGDNGDQWQQSSHRRLFDLSGVVNTSGSTIKRQYADGSVITYGWNVTRGLYVSADGEGAHDTLSYAGMWTWTDGSSQMREFYTGHGTNNWRIYEQRDTDDNIVSYTYIGDKLDKITTADGSWIQYSWSGNNITQVRTRYTNLANGATVDQTRTRYTYDGYNRLSQVTVDLSPTDNAIGDGKTYVTTYTYYGSSNQVATISQTDGSYLSISYDTAGRVSGLAQTVASGDTRATALNYGADHTFVTGPDGQIVKLEYSGGNLVNNAVWNWNSGGVGKELAGAIDGEAAVKYTSSSGANWSGIENYFSVTAGETVKYAISLKAVAGHATEQSLGLYGSTTGWSNDFSTARIISGPGQLVQWGGGFWKVVGLSATQATRIEITRTYSQSESGAAYFYVDHPVDFRDGQQLIAAGAHVTKVTDNRGAQNLLTRIVETPPQAGAKSTITEFVYNANGDLIETIQGTRSPNLLDLTNWAGEQRGPNLINLAGWPNSADGLPGGSATVSGWANPGWTIDEARWVGVVGPDGARVAAIQVGQTDAAADGGGNYTNQFAIDKSKAYEFVTYVQLTENNRHNIYFGFDGSASVVNATDGAVNTNPYFAATYSSTSSGMKAGNWYKIVGYVLPSSSGNIAWEDLGGIYDVGTGERVSGVQNFRWNDAQPAGATGAIRFFNYYYEGTQGYYLNYYKPEVHEINLAGGAATVSGWNNGLADEARWGATRGPDGKSAFAMQTGQTNPDQDGGGNHSSQVAIDRNKAYEFTYYFKLSSVDKHYVYVGLYGDLPVENLTNGAVDTNPYFYYPAPGNQGNRFVQDRWYKVVGYVLPQGSIAISPEQLGGVYDTTNGAKVDSIYNNYRWASSGGNSTMGVRYFNYYGDVNSGYSTWFYKPEIREASRYGVAANGQPTYIGEEITARKNFRYDENGNLLESRDELGNVVTRTYGGRNELLTETRTGSDASGAAVLHTTRFAYDLENHLRFVVTPEGRVTEYYYDGYGQMYFAAEYPQATYDITGIAQNVSISESSLITWRSNFDNKYTRITSTYYDSRGNVYATRSYGRGTSSWGGADYSEGSSTTYFAYDQAGRLLSRYNDGEVAENFVYDGMGRLTASTDLAGGTTNIVFNDPATQTVITLASGQVTTSTYNKAGDLVSSTASSDWSPTGTASFKYDKNGRLRMATDAVGYNRYFLYDKAGRKTADVMHNGELVEYRYDAAGRVTATISYHYNPASAQLSALANPDNSLTIDNLRTTADSGIWLWTIYDKKGRLVEEITGDGRATIYEYDQSDRLIATRTFANTVSTTGFMTTSPASVITPPVHAGDAVTRNFYDRDGRAIGMLDAEGYLSEAIYDKAGRKVEEIGYAQRTNSGYWSTGSFDQLRSTANPGSAVNRSTRNVYDGQGLLRYSVNSQGGVSSLAYNNAKRLIQTTIHAATISTGDFSLDNIKALVAGIANGAYDRTSTISYNSRGQMASTTDAAGLVTSFTYDALGQVVKTVAGERTTRNWYTQKGELKFAVDAEGFVTENSYNAIGNLVRVNRYDAPHASIADGISIAAVNALVSATNHAYNQWGYDHRGRAIDSYDANGVQTHVWYRGNGEYAHVTEASGTADASISEYNGFNHSGQVTWTGEGWEQGEQRETNYYYDGLGNLTSVLDPNSKTTSYTYDKLGRVKSVTDALGNVTLYEYDAFGNQTATRDARGYWTYNSYDNLGRLTRTTDASGVHTDSAYSVFGELASVTRAGATTSFQYDKMGRVTRLTDALGHFETYGYDVYGNRTSKTAKSANFDKVAGGTTTYTYDRRGLLISETLPMGSYNNGGGLVSSTVTNTFEYDARGNRTKMIEAAGLSEARTTQYVYDKNNRLIRTIGQTFLGQTPNEYYYYDARGNVTSTIDAANARTVFFYDDLNRKTVEINPVGTYTKYTYDKVGNVTEIRVYENAVGVPADGGSEEEAPGAPGGNARTTTFTYDNVNRMLTSSVHGAKTGVWNGSSWVIDTSAVTTTYQYDANGNVVKLTDAYDNATFSYYDALGRKTYQVDAEGYMTAWAYNADGNVTWEARYANKVASTPQVGVVPGIAGSADDRQTGFGYDLAGNRTSELRYNVLVHNGGGALTTANAAIYYSYNGLGQVIRKAEATGDYVDYSYDAAGRLMVESRTGYYDQSGSWVTPTVDYYYDGVNNLSRTRQRGSGDSAERVTQYGYDGGKLRWLYDAEGNYRYYWYDQAGRQTYDYYSRYKSDGSADTSYNGNLTSYDVMGRVVSKWQADYTGNTWTTRGPVTQLTYNAFGDVIGTYVGNILQQQSQYDLAGRMISTTSGDGLWKHFGYDKNGNQTVAITSAGSDLGSNFDGALAAIGSVNVNASYTQYDKRNMATTVVDEGRQFSAGGAYQNLTTSRSYTAFGEVASETNALGHAINYTYNTMGRMIRSESPAVDIVHENGTAQTVRPTEDYYYDASGRLVATRDANGSYSGQTKVANTGNLTVLTLLSGTGYGGSQAQVTAESHADGGVKYTKYDVHGDARLFIDEIGRQSSRTYDRLGRVYSVTSAGGLVDQYRYDILGQQLKHWNNYWGVYEVETTDYDIQGRVISQRSFGGDTTTSSYSWDGSIATSGIGTFGGWLQTTYMANGLYSQEKVDFFGRIMWKRDLGGYTTDYGYDVAGRMISSSSNGMLVSFGWYNSGHQYSVTIGSVNAGQVNTNWSRDVATYSYNVLGSRLTEYMYKEIGEYTPEQSYWNPYDQAYEYTPESYSTYTQVIKNQTAGYDALGRMTSWAEAGTATAPASTTATSYDASGNVRRTLANFYSLDANGAASTATTRDYWFRYDSMNRVVTNQGVLQNGAIVRGMGDYYSVATGQDIMYNAAGERTAAATTQAYYDGYGGYSVWEERENYFYDGAGRLSSTYKATGAAVYGGQPVPAAFGTGTLRSVFSYDLMGRATLQTDYDADGTTAIYSRSAVYNVKGQLESDYAYTKKTDNKTYATSNAYVFTDYNSGQYMLGSVAYTTSGSTVNGGSYVAARTINSYVWRDSAVQSHIAHTPNTSQGTTYNTTFYLNALGQLTGVYIADGKPRNVSFTLDELGQIIRRDETRPSQAPSGQTGSPHEVWYRFGGRQLGYTGNNGTADVTYDASVQERRIVQPTNPGTYRNGQLAGASYADFAQNYDPINSYFQGAAGGSYRVNQGDTLQGIAQSLYGDSSLWYKIAEANGMSASAALTEGQTLVLPTGVVKSKHNAGTFQPYNASEAIGDLSPTAPKPPKKPKCGVFGMILLAVIAIAVTVVTAGAAFAAAAPGLTLGQGITIALGGSAMGLSATTFGAIAVGAASAAVGSVVSQAVGVATGIQDKFSWKGVALAALGGAIGGALGPRGVFGQGGLFGAETANGFVKGALGGIKSGVLRAAANGIASSTINQGIAYATGLQPKFDWAGVAAAGVGAGVGHLVGQAIGAAPISADNRGIGAYAANFTTSMASAIANGATRSLINGSDFGDNIIAALPDVIAQTIGDMLINGINSGRQAGDTAQSMSTETALNSAIDHEIITMTEDVLRLGDEDFELLLDTEFSFSEDVVFEDFDFEEELFSFSEINVAALDGKDGVLAARNGNTPNASAGLIRGTDGEIDLSLMTDVDALSLQQAASLFDIPDVFTVLGHGPELSMRTEGEYQALSRRQRWNLISGNRGDRPVMLLSCRTGSERADWVQKLSDDLGGVAVMAATSQTWWSRDGDVVRARAYWRTSGTGGPRTGNRMNLNDPGQFRIFGGDITDFGFRALPRGYQIREIQVNSRANWVRIIAYDSQGRQQVRQRNW